MGQVRMGRVGRARSGRVWPGRVRSGWVGPGRACRVGPGRVGSGRAGPGRLGCFDITQLVTCNSVRRRNLPPPSPEFADTHRRAKRAEENSRPPLTLTCRRNGFPRNPRIPIGARSAPRKTFDPPYSNSKRQTPVSFLFLVPCSCLFDFYHQFNYILLLLLSCSIPLCILYSCVIFVFYLYRPNLSGG